MFGRRKKQPLFGSSIQPDCALCQHSIRQGGRLFCALQREHSAGSCKKFTYDPLRREPRQAPPLPEHSPDEFKL